MEEMTGGASDASARPMTARQRRRAALRNIGRMFEPEQGPAQAQTRPPSNISNDTNIIRGDIDNDRRQVVELKRNNMMIGIEGETDPHAYAISHSLLPYPPLPDPQQHALEQERARLRWEHQSRTAQQEMEERTRLHEVSERLMELNRNNIH